MAKFPYWKHMLIVLTLLGATSVTLLREHIALRHVESLLEHRISQGLQLLVHLLWLVSCWNDYQIQQSSSAATDHSGIPLIWCAGFAILAGVNAFHLIQPPSFAQPNKVRVGRILMTIPLFTYMGLIAGIWFLGVEGHDSGQAIYLHKFIQLPNIYLGIGLYIWAGMLFATTRVARLAFGLLTPWGLPIGVLAWLAVVLSALPTAYSGASGIFVIAAGAVIYEQLRDAGATKRMALAATAMSGSLGVVLRPCLVVVLVAVLNKQVTTDELFSKGLIVFGLTALLLLGALLWRNPEPLTIAPKSNAKQEFMQTLKALLPYIVVVFIAWLSYGLLLDMWVNEQTAPLILPGMLLALVIWERAKIRPKLPEEADQRSLSNTVVDATLESSTHIGALLVLMAASVALGGVVERAEIMSFFPEDLGGPVGAMTALVGLMVLIGMTMDALGAVVLVSVTLAKVAYDNGIDPTHFWMMVLVAFELGYLTPPVALNHLLAKQVIGAEANLDDDDLGFWDDNEHLWLPMLVMGVALLIVAYVPFLWY
jgi:TRAP-type C4-dicarboxylate transport system permease large subunit